MTGLFLWWKFTEIQISTRTSHFIELCNRKKYIQPKTKYVYSQYVYSHSIWFSDGLPSVSNSSAGKCGMLSNNRHHSRLGHRSTHQAELYAINTNTIGFTFVLKGDVVKYSRSFKLSSGLKVRFTYIYLQLVVEGPRSLKRFVKNNAAQILGHHENECNDKIHSHKKWDRDFHQEIYS